LLWDQPERANATLSKGLFHDLMRLSFVALSSLFNKIMTQHKMVDSKAKMPPEAAGSENKDKQRNQKSKKKGLSKLHVTSNHA
jgi:hypothetical protein